MNNLILITTIILFVSLFAFSCSTKSYKPSQFFDDQNLIFAKAMQNNDISKILSLKEKIDINHVGREDMTFIMWAILNQKKRSLEQVLKMGANPNRKDKDDKTPVAFVAAGADIDYLDILLAYKGDPNAYMMNGDPATIFTSLHGNWKNVLSLLNAGADINATDDKGNTLAMVYTSIISYEEVYKLIEMGANLDHKNKLGYTLLDRIESATPNKGTKPYQHLQRVKALIKKKKP